MSEVTPLRTLRLAVGTAMVFGLAVALACGAHDAAPAGAITDDFGDTLRVGAPPQRIVSLNPTTTELLYAIGAGPRVVGRTSYDLYPAEVLAVPDLGPGLRPNVEAVLAAHPDLVLLYASADNRDAARRLRASGVSTAAYKIDRIADMTRVTLVLGRLTGDTIAALRTVDSVRATLARVRRATAALPHPSVFWPLWESPLLAVGRGSFLNELIEIAGGRNVFADLPQPSPAVSFEELLRRDPDIIVAGNRSKLRFQADDRFRTLRAVRDHHIVVIDTSLINGPSARVGTSAVELARLLHPGVTF
ncbi:MAG: helical backbone metal receptor [Gemmatimonadota bacterium]|nr:helical backbone metal receptor [Gemmatimonadota bacterium]